MRANAKLAREPSAPLLNEAGADEHSGRERLLRMAAAMEYGQVFGGNLSDEDQTFLIDALKRIGHGEDATSALGIQRPARRPRLSEQAEFDRARSSIAVAIYRSRKLTKLVAIAKVAHEHSKSEWTIENNMKRDSNIVKEVKAVLFLLSSELSAYYPPTKKRLAELLADINSATSL